MGIGALESYVINATVTYQSLNPNSSSIPKILGAFNEKNKLFKFGTSIGALAAVVIAVYDLYDGIEASSKGYQNETNALFASSLGGPYCFTSLCKLFSRNVLF